MAIDPQVIRSEAHTEIGLIIQRDAGILVERWSHRAAEEQPNAPRLHQEALLDHLPTFLRTLGQSLADAGDNHFAHCRPASQHGEQRWETGWSLPEVVRDYQILRLVIFDYLDEILDRPLGYREVMAVGLALDEAISASISHYVCQREEALRLLQEQQTQQARQAQEALFQQAEALRAADQRKNEFLATLAHELRNPLAPLRNGLSVLQLYQTTDPTVLQIRDLFERQVQQMTRLVEDLLDVSRIAQGKIELRKERVKLAGIVAQALQMSTFLIKARQHQLEVALPTEDLWVEADQVRLVQVLVNLLNNAAKYTNPGGRIWLSAERQDDAALLRVRDNGVGIAEQMLPQVFDLFTQAEWPADRADGGLGIGLTLVKRVVELHGGQISVASGGLGQGSEFVVRLPLCPEGTSPSPALGVKEAESRPRHILIIEDNADGRVSLQTLLTLLGHRVEVAEDGLKGVALALASRPEVALIDIGLPGLDGFQVAEKIRAEMGNAVLLVALTGYGQPEDRRRALRVGFNAHLVKPVELDALQKLLVCGERGA